ncbi:unnamed protein product [Coregonus sp. 'balchen']|nr:unnamed protein product [Coregonus sp. 'balchen']
MVEWTNEGRAAITDIFSNLDYDRVTAESLERYWGFGNLNNAEAIIINNPLIAKHSVTVLRGLDRALKNMDDIKNTYPELTLLADVLTVVVAGRMGNNFTPEYQASFQRFLSVVVSALCRPYH